MKQFIPYGRQQIEQDDIDAVINVLKGDWLSSGPHVVAFEKGLSKIINSPYVLSCANGTAALHLAMLALEIGEGDYVLVAANTFLSSANAARFVGAEVIFVDVDADTGLISETTLQAAIDANSDKRLKALVNVHFAGAMANLEKIYDVAKAHNLFIIEDAAHAIGSQYENSQGQLSSIGQNRYCDLTTFSFHPIKTITTGEGGAVSAKNEALYQRLNLYRSHGMTRDSNAWVNEDEAYTNGQINPWYYEMQYLGFNYRMSDLNAALGLNQLKKLNAFKLKRETLIHRYSDAFKLLAHVKPLANHKNTHISWHLFVLLIDFEKIGKTRAEIMNALKEKGIGSQVLYIPVYKQPYYQKRYGKIALKGCESYYQKTLSLPLHPYLGKEEHEYVIDTFLKILG